jgi:hypothetical protein
MVILGFAAHLHNVWSYCSCSHYYGDGYISSSFYGWHRHPVTLSSCYKEESTDILGVFLCIHPTYTGSRRGGGSGRSGVAYQAGDAYAEGLAYAQGGIVIAGLVYVVMSGLVYVFGYEKIASFFPPIVTGPIIMTIGLLLAPTAIDMASGNWFLAFVALNYGGTGKHLRKGFC